MAFRPNPADAWLDLFNRTIHKLWELQPGDVPTEREASFVVPLLSIICEYSVEKPEKYVGSIRLRANEGRLLFSVHSDPAFVSKAGFHNDPRNYPSQDVTGCLQHDVACVLDGMIFHPRIHTHIEEHGPLPNAPPPQRLLALHEIRIGGGIENAFVFLFHLRYQFCLVSEETRGSERTRLVNLFRTAISGRKTDVPASHLFDFQR
jgi:hypothetical protein